MATTTAGASASGLFRRLRWSLRFGIGPRTMTNHLLHHLLPLGDTPLSLQRGSYSHRGGQINEAAHAVNIFCCPNEPCSGIDFHAAAPPAWTLREQPENMQTPPGDRTLHNGTWHRPDNLNSPVGHLAAPVDAVVKVNTC